MTEVKKLVKDLKDIHQDLENMIMCLQGFYLPKEGDWKEPLDTMHKRGERLVRFCKNEKRVAKQRDYKPVEGIPENWQDLPIKE